MDDQETRTPPHSVQIVTKDLGVETYTCWVSAASTLVDFKAWADEGVPWADLAAALARHSPLDRDKKTAEALEAAYWQGREDAS